MPPQRLLRGASPGLKVKWARWFKFNPRWDLEHYMLLLLMPAYGLTVYMIRSLAPRPADAGPTAMGAL
jgi:hypothetical protein